MNYKKEVLIVNLYGGSSKIGPWLTRPEHQWLFSVPCFQTITFRNLMKLSGRLGLLTSYH